MSFHFNNKEDADFWEKQIILIDESIKILSKAFKEKLKDKDFKDKYWDLFYKKLTPPHILQVLQSLKNRIWEKPIIRSIKDKWWMSTYEVRKYNKNYCFSDILKYWKKVTKL